MANATYSQNDSLGGAPDYARYDRIWQRVAPALDPYPQVRAANQKAVPAMAMTMQQSAAVANYTNEVMATRFSDVMWLLDQILNKKLDARLAAFLLEESALEQTDTLAITHEMIDEHLGSARDVVTRMLRYMKDEGLVELARGTVKIADAARLQALAGDSLR